MVILAGFEWPEDAIAPVVPVIRKGSNAFKFEVIAPYHFNTVVRLKFILPNEREAEFDLLPSSRNRPFNVGDKTVFLNTWELPVSATTGAHIITAEPGRAELAVIAKTNCGEETLVSNVVEFDIVDSILPPITGEPYDPLLILQDLINRLFGEVENLDEHVARNNETVTGLRNQITENLAETNTALLDHNVRIMGNTSSLANEIIRAATIESNLQTEINRATEAEILLQANIESEARTRADEDKSLATSADNKFTEAKDYTNTKLTDYLTEQETYAAIQEKITDYLGAPPPDIDFSIYETVEGANEKMAVAEQNAKDFSQALADGKVDKISGKQLSTNDFTNEKLAAYDAHLVNRNNPHQLTAAQLGLENVNNTSDLDKPLSTVTQTALTDLQTQLTNLGITFNSYSTTAQMNTAISNAIGQVLQGSF